MISIIIPIYNVENYLDECFQSIIKQNYKDFEIILVNDGSTDSSLEKCREFQSQNKYYTIKIIDKVNEGVTAARRDGVQAAHGEWIMFVDADDFLEENALAILTSNISNGINIILGSHSLLVDNQKVFKLNKSIGLFNYSEYIDLLLQSKVESAPWGKLFRKELFTEDIFYLPREIKIMEDFIMNFRIACKQKKNVLFINNSLYIYRYLRKDSAMYKTFHEKKDILYYINILNYISQALKDNCLYQKKKKQLAYLYFTFICSWRNDIIGQKEYVIKNITQILQFTKDVKPKNFNIFKYIYIQVICIYTKIFNKS